MENIVLTTLEENVDRIRKDKPIIVHCQSGVRAAMAYSILKRNGIQNVRVYQGGINEWTETEYQLVQ